MITDILSHCLASLYLPQGCVVKYVSNYPYTVLIGKKTIITECRKRKQEVWFESEVVGILSLSLTTRTACSSNTSFWRTRRVLTQIRHSVACFAFDGAGAYDRFPLRQIIHNGNFSPIDTCYINAVYCSIVSREMAVPCGLQLTSDYHIVSYHIKWFIFIPWIRAGLQNPYGCGNSYICLRSQ